MDKDGGLYSICTNCEFVPFFGMIKIKNKIFQDPQHSTLQNLLSTRKHSVSCVLPTCQSYMLQYPPDVSARRTRARGGPYTGGVGHRDSPFTVRSKFNKFEHVQIRLKTLPSRDFVGRQYKSLYCTRLEICYRMASMTNYPVV